jgi:ABC-type branched-subunit amino acid transport system ATPase component
MLETRDLTLHYGGSQILNGVSMRAERGEVTCVMGTNGVGKTSLMKAISGNHARSGGTLSSMVRTCRSCRRTGWRRWASATCRRGA